MRTTIVSSLQSMPVNSGTGKAGRRLARAAKIVGGLLSYSALALGSAQFSRFSAARLGPGAFMLGIPKQVGEALAPIVGVAGAAGAALGLASLALEHGKSKRGLGTPLVVLAGLTGAAVSAKYTKDAVAAKAEFASAFGADWQKGLPARLKDLLLPQRWTWRLRDAPGARVERDVVFATVPGTDRKLLADVWAPPAGVPPSGLGFIYMHGGGYAAFDKGGPTEPWFRHLATQGHVVMDISYRLIPETTVPGMQGDVKRAVAWLKRNAGRYGVDPNNIVLSGGSGGSHLALLAAYAPYHPLFTPEDVRDADLSVRGVVAYYNPGDYRRETQVVIKPNGLERSIKKLLISFLERWTQSDLYLDASGDWYPQVLLGGQPEEWPDLYRQISPIVHVGPETPPTLQVVGEHDVYIGEAPVVENLHATLRAAGVPSVVLKIPRTDHGFDLFFPLISPAAQTAMYHVDRFLALMALPAERKAASPSATGVAR